MVERLALRAVGANRFFAPFFFGGRFSDGRRTCAPGRSQRDRRYRDRRC